MSEICCDSFELCCGPRQTAADLLLERARATLHEWRRTLRTALTGPGRRRRTADALPPMNRYSLRDIGMEQLRTPPATLAEVRHRLLLTRPLL